MKRLLVISLMVFILALGFLAMTPGVNAAGKEQICTVWVIDDPEFEFGHYEDQPCKLTSWESLNSYL